MCMKKPLEGIRIIEYASWIAAPAGPSMLGDMGAEIIKVEDLRGNGDPFRRIGLSQGAPIKGKDGEDMNPWFDSANYNKNYVCIDTKTKEGMELFYKLLATADAFVTSMREEALVRRGLDYGTLSKKFPKLPYIHFVGYGSKGPWKDKPAFDVSTFFGDGGYLANSVPEGTDFLGNFPVAFADCWSAGYTASAILTGILESKMHNVGDYLSLGLYGEAYWSQRLSLLAVQFGAKYPLDSTKPQSPIIAYYKSKDGKWLILTISDHNRYYNSLMEGIGRPDLVDHPDFSTQEAMVASGRKQELREVIKEAFASMTAKELYEALNPRDIVLSDCATYEDLLNSEQGWANQYMEKIEYSTGDTSIAIAQPISSKNAGPHSFERSKVPGFHNNHYLTELGYTGAAIQELREKGVIK